MSKQELEKVAANGLINRRHLLGLGLAGMGTVASTSLLGADAGLNLEIPGWSKAPGANASGYGSRSRFTDDMQRMSGNPNPLYPGGGASARLCINCKAASRRIAYILNDITQAFPI